MTYSVAMAMQRHTGCRAAPARIDPAAAAIDSPPISPAAGAAAEACPAEQKPQPDTVPED